jgi:hypothetical protein
MTCRIPNLRGPCDMGLPAATLDLYIPLTFFPQGGLMVACSSNMPVHKINGPMYGIFAARLSEVLIWKARQIVNGNGHHLPYKYAYFCSKDSANPGNLLCNLGVIFV